MSELQPARGLENERGQLVEHVEDFQAHQDKRCDHQIKAKMHDGLENQILRAARRISLKAVHQTQYALRKTSARRVPRRQLETEGFRRRGSDAFVANLFLAGGLLFDAASCLFTRRRKS
jgi:hypothetical protein